MPLFAPRQLHFLIFMTSSLKTLLRSVVRTIPLTGILTSGIAWGAALVLPPPPNNDADGTVRVRWPSSPPYEVGIAPEYSYFTTDIHPAGGTPVAPNPPIPPGRYATWCFDVATFIPTANGAGVRYGGYLFSTSAAGTPLDFLQPFNDYLPDHPNVKKDAATWNRINYLINHRRTPFAGFVPTMWEVQHAIYRLFGQTPPTAAGYPPVRAAVVQSMIDTSTANAEFWRPGCGDLVAVVYNIDVNWDAMQTDVQLIFLEVPLLCLGDFVWRDTNGNGLQDPGEPGISGVTVNLKNSANQVIATTTTDANGKYEFSGVFGGTYTVEVDSSSAALNGLIPTLSNVGGGANAATDSNGSPTTVTLTTASDFTLDFGYVPAPASLAGFVYYDVNNNGIMEPGEAGIPGVTVNLTGSNDLGPVSLTTTTNGSGAYSFPNLRPGTYQINELQPGTYLDGKDTIGTPGGVSIVNDEFGTIVLAAGVHGVNNNFGEVLPASLAGFVYHDVDNDGIFDSGEAGIATLVTLTGTNDLGQPVNLSVMSDGTTGAYSFTNLRPGTYIITETQPATYLDGKDTIGTPGGTTGADTFTAIALAAGVNGVNNNFGEILPASLAGFVYYDVNNNGLKESGEAGIATTVTLTGTDDLGNVVSLSTTSDGTTGAYSFPNLRPGTYVITESQPVGYLDGKDTIGTPGGTTGADTFTAIALAAGVNGVNNNFGEILPASLAGFVYYDINDNGIKESGEPGIGGATVTLSGTDDLGNPVNLTTTSNGTTGAYSFTNLRPGTYVITETQPAGYLDGKDTIGTPGGTTGADTFTAITLAAGVNGVNNNFGEILPGSLGNRVWHDANKNGLQDNGEAGIDGVKVTLFTSAGLPVGAPATTSGGGFYRFDNLTPGTYYVTFDQSTLPAGYVLTLRNAGSDDAIDSDANPADGKSDLAVVLTGAFNDTVDAGAYFLTGSLGNRVWHDANKNGVQDNGETGIDGVKVTLFTAAGLQVGTPVTTASGGFYRFDDLAPGAYYVIFDKSTLPAGYVLTAQNSGSDDTVDSDANPVTGKSEGNATVVGGQFNETVDAGAYLVPPLTLACAGGTGSVGVPYTSSLVAGGGTAPYAFSITTGNLPPGLTLNPTTGAITGTPTSAGTFTYTAQVTDSTGGGARTTTANCSITVGTTPCVPTTFTFNGNTAGSGTPGNVRQYTLNGISVKVSAFSRTKATAGSVWSTAYLGSFPGGLGVTDGSEDGNGNSHTVDNLGRDNFILFEFSHPVVIDRAFLGYVSGDSDLTAWVGNANDPFNNHLTLSNAVLASLTAETNTTTSTQTRWATLNAGSISGNVLIIAADLADTSPDDQFKVGALEICQPSSSQVTLACVAATTGTVGQSYSSKLTAAGGTPGYTFSITSGALPNGLTLNPSTGTITGTPTTAGTFTFTAKVVDSTGSTTLGTATRSCSITISAVDCVPTKFTFSGNSYSTGTAGNIRQFTVNGISVKVSAFSRTKPTSGSVWSQAYLGAFSGGLGVTDGSESGSGTTHTVDNLGRDNFVLFEFSQPVVVDRAFLGYVYGDSDLTVWVGNAADPFNNHLTLSNAVLASLTREDNLTNSTGTRWAQLNGGQITGNVLVIAANLDDDTPDDQFKIGALEICQGGDDPVVLACVANADGKVGTYYSSALRVTGGTPGYTFSIVSGSLPPGLTLNPSTGVISGTPTTSGSFSFKAKVVDSLGTTGSHTASISCCLTIARATVSATGRIGSLVWKDSDGDGLQDAGEPGIGGVTVYLKNSSGNVIATDVTDSDGVYGFEGLYAGTYTVVVYTPSGYTRTTSQVGSNRAVDSNGSPASVTLATNSSSDLTIDFGFVPPTICEKPLVTYTQGGWGSKPRGNNPGSLLCKYFSAVYPVGYVTIGTGAKILKFTSADAVIAFLPQGGTAGVLSGSATNPTSSGAGVLAGQLLAATLNLDFSNSGRTAPGLGAKKVGTGPLAGKTVTEVVALADSVISGGPLPSGLTLSALNNVLTAINENYDNGSTNDGYLY
jgi:hypothetical protein